MGDHEKNILKLEKQKVELEKALEEFEKTSDDEFEKNQLRNEFRKAWLELLLERINITFLNEKKEAFETIYQEFKNFLRRGFIYEASVLIIALRAGKPELYYLEDEEQLYIPLLMIKKLIDNESDEEVRLSFNFLINDSLIYEYSPDSFYIFT